jgi:sec-independent protein translocase protein TatA
MPGMGELIVILVIVLLIFGAGKLPAIGDALGRSIKNFRRATAGNDEIEVAKRAELEDKKRAELAESSRSTAGEARDVADVADAEVVGGSKAATGGNKPG